MTEHFESTIVKLDADGNTVLSDTLEDGETLVSGGSYKVTDDGKVGKQIAHDADAATDEPRTPLEGAEPLPGVEEAKDFSSGDALPEGYGGMQSVADEESLKHAEEQDVADEKGSVPQHGEGTDAGPQSETILPEEDKSKVEETQDKSDGDVVVEGDKALGRPKTSDDKETWFNYAQQNGFTGSYEETTKAELQNYGK